MNLLLDTHIFLWAIWGSDRLSTTARQAFLDPENTLYFSMASYWEICIKLSLGKLELAPDWQKVFDREMAFNGIRWLAIEKEHCQGNVDLPFIHSDPFDRLLIAQAKQEDFTILTGDRNIPKYDVDTLT